MKKYVYLDKKLRCRIKYIKYLRHYELQLQKKWLFLWLNTYKWMTVKEGFWGEGRSRTVLKNTYLNGNDSEAYMTGTLDINKRIKEFAEEYRRFAENEARRVAKLKG